MCSDDAFDFFHNLIKLFNDHELFYPIKHTVRVAVNSIELLSGIPRPHFLLTLSGEIWADYTALGREQHEYSKISFSFVSIIFGKFF